MTVLEKFRAMCKRISKTEVQYNNLLEAVWINPKVRNIKCQYPDRKCEDCDLNIFFKPAKH